MADDLGGPSPSGIPAVDRVIAANAVWLLAGSIAALLAGLVAVLAVSRLLGPEELGRWRFAQAAASYVLVIGDAGLSAYAAREIARDRSQLTALGRPVIVTRLIVTALATAALMSILVILQTPAATVVVTLLVASTAIASALSAVFVLQGLEEMRSFGGLRVITQVSAGALSVAFTVLARRLFPAIIPFVVASFVSALITLRWAARKGTFRRSLGGSRTTAALLRAGAPFLGAAIAVQILFNADALLLQFFRGEVELGLYAAPYALASYLMILGGSLVAAAYPRIALVASSAESSSDLLADVCSVMGLIALPITIGGVLVSGQLVEALFGPAYSDEGLVFSLLLSFAILGFFNMTLGQGLSARGAERPALVVAAISAGLNVGINLVLIPRFGQLGAAVTVVISECSSAILYCLVLRPGGWQRPVNAYLSAAPQAVVMGVAVAAARASGVPVYVSIAVGVVVYVGANLARPAPGARTVRRMLRPRTIDSLA